MFYPQRLDLSEAEAKTRCSDSRAPRRVAACSVLGTIAVTALNGFWGCYIELVQLLRSAGARFATAEQVARGFSGDAGRFETCRPHGTRSPSIRDADSATTPDRSAQRPTMKGSSEISWSGDAPITFDSSS